MNVLFVWTGVTSYMADCWRKLASREGVALKVVIEERRSGRATAFDTKAVLRDIDASIVWDDEPVDVAHWRDEMAKFNPNIMFIVGWHSKTPRFFALERQFASVPKILIFDLPFVFSLRKVFAPIVLRRYLSHFEGAYVPGERAARYARWLGFHAERRPFLEKGLFSIKLPKEVKQERTGGFLYVGRFAKEKRLDVLVAAYRRYRGLVDHPWILTCSGMGPEESALGKVDGVVVKGFCSPEEVRKLYATARSFVLASAFDPWPLVILESVASGLPVICTDACGDHVELIRKNGIVCPTENVDALASAMVQMQENYDAFAKEAQKAIALAQPYSCEAWAERVIQCAKSLQ